MNSLSKISLEKFIEKTKGKKIDVPWVSSPSKLKGQCVSLIQCYIQDCLEQPAKARGNAKTWRTSYVNEGLGTIVTNPQKGDILVYGEDQGGGLGHLAIYVDSNTMYDQNNSTHDNLCAGYSRILPNYTILRPNSNLIEDVQNNTIIGKTLVLPASAQKWRVYPLNKQPIVGNECGFILPAKFGGLEYEILGQPYPDVVTIQTRDFGKVNIYIHPSTLATIK